MQPGYPEGGCESVCLKIGGVSLQVDIFFPQSLNTGAVSSNYASHSSLMSTVSITNKESLLDSRI